MNNRNRSICYICFIWVCLLLPLLIYPFLYGILDHENHESRALTQWKDVAESDWLSMFPKLESFIEDNIPYKNEVVGLISCIDESVFGDSYNADVMVGKDNWLFYKGDGCIQDYRGGQVVKMSELMSYADASIALQNAAQARGIELYLLITPNKEMIYGDRYMPDRVKRVSDVSRTDQIVGFLSNNTDVRIIYPKEALLEASGRYQVWLKYDTHWNDLGAFTASMALLGMGISDHTMTLEDVQIVENGLTGGDLANMLGRTKDYSDDINYSVKGYYDNIQVRSVETVNQRYLDFDIIESGQKTGKTVLYIGDSFLGYMKQYVSKNADKSIFIHRDNYESFGRDLIAEEKPDIIVFQIAERFIDQYDDAMLRFAGIIEEE